MARTLEKCRANMLYRYHRGSLADSMKTVVQLPATIHALAWHLNAWSQDIEVRPYGGVDVRIGWDTHIVLVCGIPVGFTNGPVNL